MKQGKFTLRKLSQLWGENSQSLNTQIPDLPAGSYTPEYPTLAQYRDDSAVDAAIDSAQDSWINVAGVNGDTGETEITRATQQKIPINVWGDLLLNGRKVITSDQYVETAFFNSLRLNDAMFTVLNPKTDLMEGEFAFTSDGNDDIFLNLGGSPAHIVRFLRSDSHLSYDNVEDIVVREINWMQAATPSSNLVEGRLWWDTTNKKLYRYSSEDAAFHMVYYLKEDDNNNTEKSDMSGDGKPRMNTLYVYATVAGSPEVKTPKSIYYYDGSDLVELGGAGNGDILICNSTTATATQTKVVTATTDATSYADLLNKRIRIYFSNGNTYRGAPLKINLNNFGVIDVVNNAQPNQDIVTNQSAGGYLDGVIMQYNNNYVLGIDCHWFVSASASSTYELELNSAAGSFPIGKTFSVRDANVTCKGSEISCYGLHCTNGGVDCTQKVKAKSYEFNNSPITLSVGGGTSSLIDEITEWDLGNSVARSRGAKRITFNMRISTAQSSIALFTVPTGYVAVTTNGTPIIPAYIGMGWYRSTYVGQNYTGQTFNVKYYDTAGTQHTVSIDGADFTCPYNDSVAFKIPEVIGPGMVTATLSSSTSRGPVVIYGEVILLPDGNAS